MYLFEGLKQKISEYLSAERVQLVQDSFVLAHEAHDGQMRSSGDPYITHPVAVAGILADMHLDHETLMAALLHDVIEDTHYNQEDLAEAFGDTVAELVEGVSKLDKIAFSSKQEAQAENFRKMMMAMVQHGTCSLNMHRSPRSMQAVQFTLRTLRQIQCSHLTAQGSFTSTKVVSGMHRPFTAPMPSPNQSWIPFLTCKIFCLWTVSRLKIELF